MTRQRVMGDLLYSSNVGSRGVMACFHNITGTGKERNRHAVCRSGHRRIVIHESSVYRRMIPIQRRIACHMIGTDRFPGTVDLRFQRDRRCTQLENGSVCGNHNFDLQFAVACLCNTCIIIRNQLSCSGIRCQNRREQLGCYQQATQQNLTYSFHILHSFPNIDTAICFNSSLEVAPTTLHSYFPEIHATVLLLMLEKT